MTSTPSPLPTALANSLNLAVEAARAAASAAAHVAASAFVTATDGEGTIHPTTYGESPDAWCMVSAPNLQAHLLRDIPGGIAQVRFTGLPQQAYEAIRAHCLASDECPHDESCDCLGNPWMSWTELEKVAYDPDIMHKSGEERGHAGIAFGRAEVTLYEEPVALVYELIRLTRTQL
ncbi:hypothetical protein ABZ851_30605 [Streptomyces sp. NPDC047049]|uniref:hypothetical protein n=1 Tax=Streptomyces sp. NPDC047049 TaxID=3156688 RepID=UPI0033E2A166